MIKIKPIQVGFPVKEAIIINISIGNFSTTALKCRIFWKLFSEKEIVLAEGSIELTESQFTEWGQDMRYIEDITFSTLGIERE